MRIVVDAHGGDNAPFEIIKGCCMAIDELEDISILLVGRKNELQEIMTATKTGMSEMDQSEGVYVKFISGGETIIIHSKPLNAERTKEGTVDLHEEKLGFATFDRVSADTMEGKELTAIDMNALSELISESLLVSLYEHY